MQEGAVPSSHHVLSPIAVNERGTKPAGTGSPAGGRTTVVSSVVTGGFAVDGTEA